MALPRMRTIPQIVAEMKQQDENTAISTHYLRGLVKSGKIPYVSTGRKILICIDNLDQYLQPGLESNTEPTGSIRKLAE